MESLYPVKVYQKHTLRTWNAVLKYYSIDNALFEEVGIDGLKDLIKKIHHDRARRFHPDLHPELSDDILKEENYAYSRFNHLAKYKKAPYEDAWYFTTERLN